MTFRIVTGLLPALLASLSFFSSADGASLVATSPSPGRPGCGGVVVGSGEIRYKVGEQYDAKEQCVWTLINQEYPLLSVDMTEEGFAENGDHLEIFYYKNGYLFNPVPGAGPHCDGPILSRRNQFCMVNSSMVFLVFRTNQALQGTGFSVKVEPSGSLLPPSGDVYEPYTPTTEGNAIDYDGQLKSNKIVSWALVNPTEFVLYRYNITPPCTSTNTTTPSFTIYQANRGQPIRMNRVCGVIDQPLRLIQAPQEAEPFIIIYENGKRTYSKGEVKFYWNLDEPPAAWKPEKGAGFSVMVGSVSTFWSGLVIIVMILMG